jgi:hypothetical protein
MMDCPNIQNVTVKNGNLFVVARPGYILNKANVQGEIVHFVQKTVTTMQLKTSSFKHLSVIRCHVEASKCTAQQVRLEQATLHSSECAWGTVKNNQSSLVGDGKTTVENLSTSVLVD